MNDLVCIELKYSTVNGPAHELVKTPMATGVFVFSTTVLKQHNLARVVEEMCRRLNWYPVIYRRLDSITPPPLARSYAARVFSVLTR